MFRATALVSCLMLFGLLVALPCRAEQGAVARPGRQTEVAPGGEGEAQEVQTVVSSKTTKVYHRPSCRHVARIKEENRQEFKNAAAAEKEGHRACRACFKPEPEEGEEGN